MYDKKSMSVKGNIYAHLLIYRKVTEAPDLSRLDCQIKYTKLQLQEVEDLPHIIGYIIYVFNKIRRNMVHIIMVHNCKLLSDSGTYSFSTVCIYAHEPAAFPLLLSSSLIDHFSQAYLLMHKFIGSSTCDSLANLNCHILSFVSNCRIFSMKLGFSREYN